LTEEKILKGKIASKAEVDKIKNAIDAEIEAAMNFADESDFPLGSELYDDNYVQQDYPYIMD
jgi:pyruvate dehydrogenase E1 component alpha subunit